MKKVLIYKEEDLLKKTGGPSGYLYNLRKGLSEIGPTKDVQIDFLPPRGVGKRSVASRAPKSLINLYRRLKHIKICLSLHKGKKVPPVDFSKYDIVHFHSTFDLFWTRDALKDFKGIVLLTSHSPQPLSQEFVDSSSKIELFFFGQLYKKAIMCDEYAFRRADYIIFPCEFSDEPYEHRWPDYSLIKQEKKQNYRFLLTGTAPAEKKLSSNRVREMYGIPPGAFVICYVGRHNAIKGYDSFVELATRILNKHENSYVLVAGREGPISSPRNSRWIEAGWTEDPHSLIAASNVFVLPNRETFFDLVLLEVLSLGTPIVASNTGGNKFFINSSKNGIRLYNTLEEGASAIESIFHCTDEEIKAINNANTGLFESLFTTRKFAENYLTLIQNLKR